MQVATFDFIDLIDAVQTELRIMNENNHQLTEEQHQELSHFFQAFISLAEQKTYWNYDSTFTMLLNGVPDKLYNDFQLISRKTKIPLSQLFNILMNEGMRLEDGELLTADVLKQYVKQKARYSINNYGFLTITNQDLEEIDYPVNFNNIEELTFADDLTEATFMEKVNSINNCDAVNFTSRISKLVTLTKIQNCDRISFMIK